MDQESTVVISASEARKNLFRLIEQVNADHQPVEITSRSGDAVLVSKSDYDALAETAYLLRVPSNAVRLLESLASARKGEGVEIENFAQSFRGEEPLRWRPRQTKRSKASEREKPTGK
jgi:antitoxin YefM